MHQLPQHRLGPTLPMADQPGPTGQLHQAWRLIQHLITSQLTPVDQTSDVQARQQSLRLRLHPGGKLGCHGRFLCMLQRPHRLLMLAVPIKSQTVPLLPLHLRNGRKYQPSKRSRYLDPAGLIQRL